MSNHFFAFPLSMLGVLSALAGCRGPTASGNGATAQDVTTGASDFFASVKPGVDARVQQSLDLKGAVGVVIAVLDGDDTAVWSYGETKIGSGTRPDADTFFDVESVTKSFTGTLLSLELHDHTVALEDTVASLWPGNGTCANGTPLADTVGGRVTLGQLATHRSGLLHNPQEYGVTPDAAFDASRLLEVLCTLEPPPPGPDGRPRFIYSNIGSGALGYLLASKNGKPFDAYLRDRLLAPLGMNDSRFALEPADMARAIQGYDALLRPAPLEDAVPMLEGAAGLKSTVRDLARYVRAQWSDPRYAAAHEPVDGSQEVGLPDSKIGFLWNIDKVEGGTREVVDKGGGGHAFYSWVGFDKQRKIGAVMLATGNNFPAPHALVAPIFDAPQAFPWALPQIDDPSAFRGYVGEYTSADNPIGLTLDLSGGLFSLTAHIPGQSSSPSARVWAMSSAPDGSFIIPSPGSRLGDPATFYANDVGAILTASKGDGSSPPSFVARGAFAQATYVRKTP